jgi:hypothetical protein
MENKIMDRLMSDEKKLIFLFICLVIWKSIYNYLDGHYLETLLGINRPSLLYYVVVFPVGLGSELLILYFFIKRMLDPRDRKK